VTPLDEAVEAFLEHAGHSRASRGTIDRDDDLTVEEL